MDWNWKFHRLRVLLVILVLVCHSLCLCSSLNDEGLALLRLRERVVSDPFGALVNWRSIDSENDPCLWFGVECSDGKVVVLDLKDLCLEGTLAPELENLVYIKSIVLRNNSFTGIIPEGLGELKELEVLDLGYNNFSGPLPSDLGINLSLAILLLDNNEQLLGRLSPEIYKLQILSESQVDENHLSSAAKNRPSCNRRFITLNGVQTEDAVHRRLLQEPIKDTNLFWNPFTPVVNASLPPPSISPSPPFPVASATPAATPNPNDTVTTPSPSPKVSVSPPTLLAPTPSSSPKSARSSGSLSSKHIAIIVGGTIGGAVFLLTSIIGICLCRSNKVSNVKPWATGLSGQLQKAFVTGVPNLKRSELESACEDFSNVIGSSPIGFVYKGTLSSGVEIAVASIAVASSKDWSKHLEVQFRKKIDTLSKVNHKNFVNLIGYCEEEEPFTRMMVFEYAPNGTLFEHLHIRESEHLDWGMRMRIAMGIAYCLEHLHQLKPPISHNYLNSAAVNLTEDYAAKLSDLSFSHEITAAEMEATGKKLTDVPSVSPGGNVYSFGVLLFEMITGRVPYLVDNSSLEDWAADYLRGEQPLREIVDPTLRSLDEQQLEKMGELIKFCAHPEREQRPAMREVTAILREITGITHDGAIPKLSPLWWAELEILSTEAI